MLKSDDDEVRVILATVHHDMMVPLSRIENEIRNLRRYAGSDLRIAATCDRLERTFKDLCSTTRVLEILREKVEENNTKKRFRWAFWRER